MPAHQPSMSRNLRQLICIDLDGPILDVSERYYRVYSDTLNSIGFKPLNKESYWNLKRSKVSEPEIIAQSGTPDNDLMRIYLDTRAKRIESAEYLVFDQVWPGTLDTLKALRSRHALALVTMRTSSELLARQLERLKLHDAFDCVLAAGLVANDRGEQKAQLVRDYYRNEDFMGWFVGDSEADIQSGRLLGLRTAAITFGIRTVEQITAVSPEVVLQTPAEFQTWARNVDSANV